MKKTKSKWKLVTDFAIDEYRCGLRSGDRVRVMNDIIVRDMRGKPTGAVHKAGEIWTVLSGSKDDPGVIRLLQADGYLHFWDDDPTIYEQFEKMNGEQMVERYGSPVTPPAGQESRRAPDR